MLDKNKFEEFCKKYNYEILAMQESEEKTGYYIELIDHSDSLQTMFELEYLKIYQTNHPIDAKNITNKQKLSILNNNKLVILNIRDNLYELTDDDIVRRLTDHSPIKYKRFIKCLKSFFGKENEYVNLD